MGTIAIPDPTPVVVGSSHLAGLLVVPPDAKGLVIFAHGSGIAVDEVGRRACRHAV